MLTVRASPVLSLEEMPTHRIAQPRNAAEERARFYNSGNGFNLKLAPVAAEDFKAEAMEALSPATAGITTSRFIDCEGAGFSGVATSPLMLARYAVIGASDCLESDDNGQQVVYVIRGAGKASLSSGEEFSLAPGDVLIACDICKFSAAGDDMVLWCVNSNPMNRLLGVTVDRDDPRFVPVFYPASVIEEELRIVLAAPRSSQTSGRALIFSSVAEEDLRAVTPALTLSFNTLFPGETQPPHRHNATAITLVVAGEGCHTVIDGVPFNWSPWTTLVTPPSSMHAHVNNGPEVARFLIVQDGALYYHARTMDLRHGE
jgi:quercetin dioxygenase-like cupin family protein